MEQLRKGEEYEKKIEKLIENEKKRKEKLKQMGIDYDWVGYEQLIKKKPKLTKFQN